MHTDTFMVIDHGDRIRVKYPTGHNIADTVVPKGEVMFSGEDMRHMNRVAVVDSNKETVVDLPMDKTAIVTFEEQRKLPAEERILDRY